jgi:myxalamid-type polyketide synthase MxaE and MxaD
MDRPGGSQLRRRLAAHSPSGLMPSVFPAPLSSFLTGETSGVKVPLGTAQPPGGMHPINHSRADEVVQAPVDPGFAERLGSVLRHVHGALVSTRTLTEGDRVISEDQAAESTPRQVVWINRQLSGPDFLRAALPELRALLKTSRGASLWCVTREAHTKSLHEEGAFDGLSRAVVWGFGRSIQHEQPRLECTLVDFDRELTIETECELLAAEFRRNSADPQVRFVAGSRQVAAVGEGTLPQPSADSGALLSQQGSYLVTGGAGGLGRLVAEELADAGAGHVIIASRRPRDLESLKQRLEARDTRVTIWELDVSDREALQREIERLQRSGPPLRGIVHAAGVVRDHTLEQIDEADLQAVFAAKVSGAWHLHELTLGAPLDFFLVYSSLAGVLGSPGQANYAGANAFLDALVEARNRAGLVGASLAWGPWAEVGMAAGQDGAAARLGRLGLAPLSNLDGLSFLRTALAGARGLSAVADIDWSTYAANVPPRLHGGLPLESTNAVDSCPGQLGAELRALANGQAEEAKRRLESYLHARILDVAGSRVISDHDSFFELGLDSLQAIAMRNRLERDLGIELSPSLIFDYPTLADLRAHLLSDHLGVQGLNARPDDALEFASPTPDLAWAELDSSGPSNGWQEDAAGSRLLSELEASMRALERDLES